MAYRMGFQVFQLLTPRCSGKARGYMVADKITLAWYFESAEDLGLIQYQANITLPVHYIVVRVVVIGFSTHLNVLCFSQTCRAFRKAGE